MTAAEKHCSPGSHPHADRPNWRPAETLDDYLANCREGLEEYSDRRVAKLLGVSRILLWRAQQMAEIPEELFERLLAGGIRSTKAMAQIGQALKQGNGITDLERCPHCGRVVRARARVSKRAVDIVNQWIDEQNNGEAAS